MERVYECRFTKHQIEILLKEMMRTDKYAYPNPELSEYECIVSEIAAAWREGERE